MCWSLRRLSMTVVFVVVVSLLIIVVVIVVIGSFQRTDAYDFLCMVHKPVDILVFIMNCTHYYPYIFFSLIRSTNVRKYAYVKPNILRNDLFSVSLYIKKNNCMTCSLSLALTWMCIVYVWTCVVYMNPACLTLNGTAERRGMASE